MLVRLLAGGIITVGLALTLPASAGANLWTVDSRTDRVDATPADGVCASVTSRCTLRAAIEEANHNPGDDEIQLPEGVIRLRRPVAPGADNAEGDLDVSDSVEIVGHESFTRIEQTVNDRVLTSNAASAPGLRLTDLQIAYGRVYGAAGTGGGGGIQNHGFAQLTEVDLFDNVAVSDESDTVPGGGIWSEGTLVLSNTNVQENTARGSGDAEPSAGGVMIADGTLTVEDGSRIIRNSVEVSDPGPDARPSGGGVVLRNPGGEPEDSASVFESTIGGNSAFGGPHARAGGISAGPGTTLHLLASTLSGNRSRRGGGLYARQSSVNATNSTFSGNLSDNGGAAILQQSEAGYLDLMWVTVARNDSSEGHFAIESGQQSADGSVTLFASIVANPGPECGGAVGAVQSDGMNVVSDQTCGFNPAPGMDIRAAPMLRELGRWGGTLDTHTHLLRPQSPAVDHVTDCAAGVDQRGISRPQGPACDSGSVELETD